LKISVFYNYITPATYILTYLKIVTKLQGLTYKSFIRIIISAMLLNYYLYTLDFANSLHSKKALG